MSSPEAIGARKAKNGFYYIPDPDRPGKFMIVLPKKGAAERALGRYDYASVSELDRGD